jgi:hypothetical protein
MNVIKKELAIFKSINSEDNKKLMDELIVYNNKYYGKIIPFLKKSVKEYYELFVDVSGESSDDSIYKIHREYLKFKIKYLNLKKELENLKIINCPLDYT